MAEKTACGCFLLLRNKKQLILMAPARGLAGWPKKTACGCFSLLRNKKQLILMAPARGLAGWPKNSLRFAAAIFYSFASQSYKNGHVGRPGPRP